MKLKTLVLDSSVVLKWFWSQDEAEVEAARNIYAYALKNNIVLMAPHFLLIEISNVLLRAKKLSRGKTQQVLNSLTEGDILFQSDSEVDLHKTMYYADRYHLSMYDALYLQLAEKYQCPLITADAALANAGSWPCTIEKFTQKYMS